MRCRLFSNDGPLMSAGTCELAEDGTITMVTDEWHSTPMAEGPPLELIVEDGTELVVRVTGVHVVKSDPEHGHVEEYRFTTLQDVDNREMDGSTLERVRTMWSSDRISPEPSAPGGTPSGPL